MRPVVLVDDNEHEELLARECYQASNLRNPWQFYERPRDFLAFIDRVRMGQEALPEVVLMDINMPEMSGFDVLERLAAEGCKDLNVIVLTHSDSPSDRAEAQRHGARFQTKPGNVHDYVAFFNTLP